MLKNIYYNEIWGLENYVVQSVWFKIKLRIGKNNQDGIARRVNET